MTRQVALSNDAYTALKREKREAESFSDVVMRLMRQARVQAKDPMRFVQFPHRRAMTHEAHLRMVEEMRDADRAEPRGRDRASAGRPREH